MSTKNKPEGLFSKDTPEITPPASPVASVEVVPPQKVETPAPSVPVAPSAILPRPQVSQEVTDRLAMDQYEETNRALFPTEKMLSVMVKFADHCVQTQQMPNTINSAAKALMVFQAGREMGVPPIKSLYSFYFVNNKLTMYGATVIERIRMWAKIEYGVCDKETATVTITRKDDGTSLSSTITMKELNERGVTSGKDTFKKHPRTMLIYKAVGEIVRHIVPEAVGAMAVEGDYSDNAEQEKSRVGSVHEVVQEVPSVMTVVKNYDRQTIMNRLAELDVDVDEKSTKQQLAERLVEELKKGQDVVVE